MGRGYPKGLALSVGSLSSRSLGFLPSFWVSFVISLLSSWIFMMYTKFFTKVSWVVSVDASLSTPNLISLTGILSQVPIYTVLLTCSSSSFFCSAFPCHRLLFLLDQSFFLSLLLVQNLPGTPSTSLLIQLFYFH